MKSIETREGQAYSHFKVAVDLYKAALELFSAGPDRIIPHPNPEFQLARNQIILLLDEADSNLDYARDFGMTNKESLKLQRESVSMLRKQLIESKK